MYETFSQMFKLTLQHGKHLHVWYVVMCFPMSLKDAGCRTHQLHPHDHSARCFPICVSVNVCVYHYANQRDCAPSFQTSGPVQAHTAQSKSLSRQAVPRSPLFCSVRDLPYCCSRSFLSFFLVSFIHLSVQIASPSCVPMIFHQLLWFLNCCNLFVCAISKPSV